MSLTHAILATLVDGPHHAYRIRLLAADLLGPFFAVNQGQVYATLHRLAIRGLIEVAPAESPPPTATPGAQAQPPTELRRFRLTPNGRQELERWLGEPSEAPGGAIDLASRLVVLVARGDETGAQRLLTARRTRLRGLVTMVERLSLPLCEEGWLGRRAPLRTAARRAILAHLDAELAWVDLAERAVAKRLDAAPAVSPSPAPAPRELP